MGLGRLLGRIGLAVVAFVLAPACQPKSQSSEPQPETVPESSCGWVSDENLFIADANLLTPYRMRLDPISPLQTSADVPEVEDLEFNLEKAARGGLDLAVLEILVTSADLELAEPREKNSQRTAGIGFWNRKLGLFKGPYSLERISGNSE